MTDIRFKNNKKDIGEINFIDVPSKTLKKIMDLLFEEYDK